MIIDGQPLVRVVSSKASVRVAAGWLSCFSRSSSLKARLDAGSPFSDGVVVTESLWIAIPGKGVDPINDRTIDGWGIN